MTQCRVCQLVRSLWPCLFGLVIVVALPGSAIVAQQSHVANDAATFKFSAPQKIGSIDSPLIDESSGLAASRKYPGNFWTHNDNGDKPGLFLIDSQGTHRATVQLTGAKFEDWEDICSFVDDGHRSRLVLADVGDNARRRSIYRLYVLREPQLKLDESTIAQIAVADFTTIQFTYPDGSHDCEAVAYDHVLGEFWLVSREFARPQNSGGRHPGVYRLKWAPGSNTDQPLRAEFIGKYSSLAVTGMDIAANRRLAVVRNYLTAKFYVRQSDEGWGDALCRDALATITLPLQRQGEAVCFDTAAESILISSERIDQPFWKIELALKQHR